ncbi:hypothetical protein BDV18DRAFT_140155 [Aspergillus unguis]
METTYGYVLPTELLQGIFSLLDIESFYSAFRTCRVWRYTALSTLLLKKQLGDAPVLSATAKESLPSLSLEKVETLFTQLCRKNLIGMKRDMQIRTSPTTGIAPGDIPVRSQRGCHTARLQGMTLVLETAPEDENATQVQELQLSSTIFPVADAVRQIIGYTHGGAFFRPRSFARMQVALGSCGEVLAVALGRRVQIYSLVGLGKEFVEGDISEDVLDSVQRVEFADNGLLRIEIDGSEGMYVRYLGVPDQTKQTKLEYWGAALQKVYLDSRTIERGLGGGASLRGLRVINHGGNDCEKKCFLALLRGSDENAYIVGQMAQDGAVEIIQRCPTQRATLDDFHSKTKETDDAQATSLASSSPLLDRWDEENLPRAHSHEPYLTVSDDEETLVIAEPPHGNTQGGLYICSSSINGEAEPECTAWPLKVYVLDQHLEGLNVTRNKQGGYTIEGQSQRQNTLSGSQMIQWTMSNAPKP